MKNSELYQLIFHSLINSESVDLREEIKQKVILNKKNLFQFIQYSSNHLVLPAVYFRLKRMGLTNYMENNLKDHLDEIYTLNAIRNKEILQQIDDLSRNLNKKGIEPIFLKGTGNLLDNLYSEKADRLIGDIDLLVQKKEFLKTVDYVTQLGYKTDQKIYDDFESIKDYPHQFIINGVANIEIHRLPVIVKHAKWFKTDFVFKDKKKIPDRVNCFVPSDNHKLIINFIHSQLSNKGHNHKNISLRDLYDLYLLSQRINTNTTLSIIKEREKARIYFDFLSLLTPNWHTKKNHNKQSIRFFKKHQWFKNNPKIHYLYIITVNTIDIFVNRILKALTNTNVRKNLIVRIIDTQWWRNRLPKAFKDNFYWNHKK